MALDTGHDPAVSAAETLSLPALRAELTTRSGLNFQVRSADESDECVLAEFFTHVSQEDLRFRFLSGIRMVGRQELALLTQIDHRRTENLLAFDPMTGCLLASAMLGVEEDLEHAEVAIVIRSDFKNRGIGWSLLEHAGQCAAALGAKNLQSIEYRDNVSAIVIETEMGFTQHAYPGDATLVILEKSLGRAELPSGASAS